MSKIKIPLATKDDIDKLNEDLTGKLDKSEVSNPNLLDNPFFNVNSRGQSVYTSKGYTVDRWYIDQNNISKLTKNDDCLRIERLHGTAGNSYYMQYINEFTLKENESITFSMIAKTNSTGRLPIHIILDDGSRKYLGDAKRDSEFVLTSYTYINDGKDIKIKGVDIQHGVGPVGEYYDIKVMKLELGSVSTLHLDTAPDVEEERLKCMISTADSSDTYANKGVVTEDLWKPAKTYLVGKYCIWNGIMWKCKIQHSGQEPIESDTTYWEKTSISDELINNKFTLSTPVRNVSVGFTNNTETKTNTDVTFSTDRLAIIIIKAGSDVVYKGLIDFNNSQTVCISDGTANNLAYLRFKVTTSGEILIKPNIVKGFTTTNALNIYIQTN